MRLDVLMVLAIDKLKGVSMKKLGHLGVYTSLVFLSVYLPELGIMHLTKFLGWGINGYSIFLTVEVTALLLLFIYWLKKERDALYF